ncbi:MAG TPA: DUF4129 domain-containing protein [Gemmatimonadaceae bacterium]|nr:DUF4129 domain-containing protein [Gemmatimonadaceae bacterium]
MIPTPPGQIPDSLIRSVTDSVFRAGVYNRYSVWDRVMGWIGDRLAWLLGLIGSLFGTLHRSPPLYWTVIVLLAATLLLIIGRALWLWYLRGRYAAAGLTWDAVAFRRAGRDPWQVAQELAARREFTDAAHALYAALLEAAARRREVRLHPSKTAGDYVRELRTRSSSIFGRFREFARSYETVIYGLGTCDEERFLRLRALAVPIVRPDGDG